MNESPSITTVSVRSSVLTPVGRASKKARAARVGVASGILHRPRTTDSSV